MILSILSSNRIEPDREYMKGKCVEASAFEKEKKKKVLKNITIQRESVTIMNDELCDC